MTNHRRRTRSRSRSHSLKDGVECLPPLRATAGEHGGAEFQLDGASTTFTTKLNGLKIYFTFPKKATRIRRKSRKSLNST